MAVRRGARVACPDPQVKGQSAQTPPAIQVSQLWRTKHRYWHFKINIWFNVGVMEVPLWLGLHAFTAESPVVQSLVGELRSCKPKMKQKEVWVKLSNWHYPRNKRDSKADHELSQQLTCSSFLGVRPLPYLSRSWWCKHFQIIFLNINCEVMMLYVFIDKKQEWEVRRVYQGPLLCRLTRESLAPLGLATWAAPAPSVQGICPSISHVHPGLAVLPMQLHL